MTDIFRRGLSAVGTGLDSAFGNVATDPSFKNTVEFVRDLGVEALPGEQRTNLDVNVGEGLIKLGGSLRDRGLIDTGIHRHTQHHAGNLRESMVEKGLSAGVRKAGQVLAKRLPGMASKWAAGTVGSGGALAIPMTIWAAGDAVDTASQIVTGRGIADHHADPAVISTANRQRFRHGGF